MIGINAGFIGSYVLLYNAEIQNTYQRPPAQTMASFLVLLNVACALIFIAYRLYSIKRAGSRVDEAYKVFVATAIATLVASVIGTVVRLPFTPKNLVYGWLLSMFAVIVLRNICRSLLYHARTRGFDRAHAP